MKFFFSLLVLTVSLSSFAQVDSAAISDVYKLDTIIVADTSYVVDTVIVQDTMLVKISTGDDIAADTIFLSSHHESWSLIPDTVIEEEEYVIRKDSGKYLLSAKISFADTYDDNDWEGYSISNLAPIAIQLEYFQNDLLSYGGHLLYGRNKYTNDTLTTSYVKNSVVGVAAIGTFHYGTWLQDITNNWFKFGYLDLYASVALRFDVHRDIKEHYWNTDLDMIENQDETSLQVKLRPIFGARYYISDRFSVNVELGKGNLGMLSSSVSWSL